MLQQVYIRAIEEGNMVPHYAPKDFFRYFRMLCSPATAMRGLFGDLDFSAMKETQSKQSLHRK